MAYRYNPTTGQIEYVSSAGGASSGVTSVNNKTGVVTLTATDVGADPTGTAQALFTTLGDKYVRTTRFAIISSGTSGTITLPTNSEVVLDDFGGTVDAVVSQVSGGKPTLQPSKDSTQTIVATSFDSSGNYVFSSTPSVYPVAILYRVRQKISNFDSTASDIWGNSNIEHISNTNIQIFDTSGTYIKPIGPNGESPRIIMGYMLGGGGGSGSGRKGAAATVRTSGGTGSNACVVMFTINAATVGATSPVVVGAGGNGGASITVNSTSGAIGIAGGLSSFAGFKAQGGNPGTGGTAVSATAGALVGINTMNSIAGIAGIASSATGAAGTAGTSYPNGGPAIGGTGGGITSANAASAGAAGGAISSTNLYTTGANGGTAGAIGVNGGDGPNFPAYYGQSIGSGGGGGGSSITANAGNGGKGGRGASGGSGGAALDDVGNSGAGGAGGDGWVIIVTEF